MRRHSITGRLMPRPVLLFSAYITSRLIELFFFLRRASDARERQPVTPFSKVNRGGTLLKESTKKKKITLLFPVYSTGNGSDDTSARSRLLIGVDASRGRRRERERKTRGERVQRVLVETTLRKVTTFKRNKGRRVRCLKC